MKLPLIGIAALISATAVLADNDRPVAPRIEEDKPRQQDKYSEKRPANPPPIAKPSSGKAKGKSNMRPSLARAQVWLT